MKGLKGCEYFQAGQGAEEQEQMQRRQTALSEGHALVHEAADQATTIHMLPHAKQQGLIIADLRFACNIPQGGKSKSVLGMHRSRPMQLFEDLGKSPKFPQLEPEPTQLELRLEPQALILGLCQSFECCAIEALPLHSHD